MILHSASLNSNRNDSKPLLGDKKTKFKESLIDKPKLDLMRCNLAKVSLLWFMVEIMKKVIMKFGTKALIFINSELHNGVLQMVNNIANRAFLLYLVKIT